MTIEGEKHLMDVRHADPYGSRLDDANLAGSRNERANLVGASIVDGRLEGATIDGIAVTDLLAYWHAGHGANGA